MTQQETTTHPTDLFDALYTRALMNDGERGEYHLAMIWDANVDYGMDNVKNEQPAREAVARERVLKAKGDEYFKQGYRLHSTDRQIVGLGFKIPQGAIAWETRPSGYIAMNECERLWYVTKS